MIMSWRPLFCIMTLSTCSWNFLGFLAIGNETFKITIIKQFLETSEHNLIFHMSAK